MNDFWTHPEIIAATVAAIGALVAAIVSGVKSLFKKLESIISELQPNGGSSMRDQVNRLESNQEKFMQDQQAENGRTSDRLDKIEEKVEKMYDIVITKLTKD
jgi:predicted PurR-regulated permease PerM